MTTYGWRIYAIPILVAVTVLVFVQTYGGEDTATGTGQAAVQGQAGKQPAGDGDSRARTSPNSPRCRRT